MKCKAKLAGLALSILLLFALPLAAQESGGPPQGGGQGGTGGGQGGMGGGGMRPPKPPVDTALDVDGDGTIDASEISNAATALKKLDTSGSGQLTREQCLPQRPGGQGGRAGQGTQGGQGMQGGQGATGGSGATGGQGGRGGSHPLPPIYSALDANGDGVVSSAELAGAPAALKKLDKNGDGKLSPDEYRPPRPDEQGMGQGRSGGTQSSAGGPQGQGGRTQGQPGGTQGK